MNYLGIISAGLIAMFVAGAAQRSWRWILAAHLLVAMIISLLAQIERPSPVGCVNELDVWWYSPFWWTLTLTHIAANLSAAMFCFASARNARDSLQNKITFNLLAAGWAVSTGFWLAMLLITITGWVNIIYWAQYLVGATAWLLTAGLICPSIARLTNRLYLAYTFRQLWWLHHNLAVHLDQKDDTLRPVRLVRLVADRSWLPAERLYRLEVEIKDQLTAIRDQYAPCRNEIYGGITSATTSTKTDSLVEIIREMDLRYPNEQTITYLKSVRNSLKRNQNSAQHIATQKGN